MAASSGRRGFEAGVVRPDALSTLLRDLFEAGGDASERRWDDALRPGAVMGRFELVREIGRGGFGIVYEAKDLELGRSVAFKALRQGKRPDAADEQLLREAEIAARLTHPNIVTIYDVGRAESGPYLILELLHGQTLAHRLQLGPLPTHEALRIAVAIAEGLAHAHSHGVVHRDLTPGNVFLCDDGRVKLLDLGMAHAFGRRKLEGGTPAYMAPEQWSGAPEDERVDVFALGAVLYECLTDQRPPPDRDALERRRRRHVTLPEVPGLGAFVDRMLDDDPLKRPRDAGEVLEALLVFARELRQAEAASRRPVRASLARRPRWLVPVAVAALAVTLGTAWFIRRELRIRRALEELPRLTELVESGQTVAAFALASQLDAVIPRHPTLLRDWPEISRTLTFETTPPGADVYARVYADKGGGWRHLGRTPLAAVRLPWVLHRIRVEREGFEGLEAVPRALYADWGRNAATGSEPVTVRFTLDRAGSLPPGTVRVGATRVPVELWNLDQRDPVQLGDYLIDRREVTNREFQAFVDAGGYRRRGFWREPFVKDGRSFTWEEAMASFRDTTDRPGPATWASGTFPEGQGDLPVTGVSWYEAAAYAVFVGKVLPNVYQWSHAAGAWASPDILPRSNFGTDGLAAAGAYEGVGPFGTRDMAGNAKEWCWNASGDRRYALGGAWNEPTYMFFMPDTERPFARPPNLGFRLAKELDDRTSPDARAPIPLGRNDASVETMSAEQFSVARRSFEYDAGPLDAKTEAYDDSSERWTKEKVSFAAAYGGERVSAYLFVPKRGTSPFQTVLLFPGSSAIASRSSDRLAHMAVIAPVISSGRAVLYPVYKSTYERRDGVASFAPARTSLYREHVIAWTKDVARSLDYIETRRDLDSRKVALLGISWGGRMVPLVAAVEPRVRAGIMVGAGLANSVSFPEVDPAVYAPYAHQPMLMLNGRYDSLFPVETSQTALFKRLGATSGEKRHVVLDSGHQLPLDQLTREILGWLDRQFGPAA